MFLLPKLCWEAIEASQPEITCPMTFNWFPFDTQYCYVLLTVSPYRIKLTTPKIESLLLVYHQNIVLDYNMELLELPEHKSLIEISKVILDSNQTITKIIQAERELWEAEGVPLPETHKHQAGFTYKLTRMWSKYVYLYYIPSGLCVLASLNSFLIKPEVNKTIFQ